MTELTTTAKKIMEVFRYFRIKKNDILSTKLLLSKRHEFVPERALAGKNLGIRYNVFMKNLYLALLLLFSFSTQAFAGDDVQNACNVFYKKMKAVPHDKLVVNTGLLHSVSTSEEFRGCEVVFKSKETLMAGLELPSFQAPEGSWLYRQGWRIDEHFRADGAGSGAYGIVKGRLLCRISWDQYSFVNDVGEVEQSELINMTIQCMNLQELNSPE